MAKDLVYVFDKLTKKGSVFGEIQSDFNISLVIDGTKDSTTILVWSYSGVEIEPYSIILHKKTMSWWVVSHDKVERYQNDDGEFIYVHNLELLGAIELLNARDLTDCGFNDNTYIVSDFIYRLFDLSNVEYILTIIAESNFLNKVVDFIKTFENYTLLSALREFLDAYNMCPKLSFGYSYNSTTDIYTLTDMTLSIIPKTGNRSRVHQMSEFDDVRETKTMDKNSFGTTVISNAENVISSKDKIYPSTGSAKLSSTEVTITPENAVLRLPSKVFNAKWIKLYYNLGIRLIIISSNRTEEYLFGYKSDNDTSFEKMMNYFSTQVLNDFSQQFLDSWLSNFESYKETIKQQLKLAGVITFYDGNKIVPYFGQNNNQNGEVIIEKGDNVPYLVNFTRNFVNRPIIFTDKTSKELLQRKWQGIAWERGSNLITGFDLFNNATEIEDLTQTDLQKNIIWFYDQTIMSNRIILKVDALGADPNDTINIFGHPYLSGDLSLISFKVCYTPMSDLKIKIDNQRDKKDIQLYNQNGRITDCVALSKMLNSYSKEISSDTITKYMHYYYSKGSFFGVVPNVGDIVVQGNDEYVINNISMDFAQNETSVSNDFGYFIDCEITMSKWVSTKSLMVNPNTNIRDYGIPQNFNVKRKQLYRDYYELSYSAYSDADNNPYLATNKIFNFTHTPNVLADFIAVMKISYRNAVEGQNSWYYQLETTNYYLDKMLCVMLDFQDNNIIGYGSQNVFSGFVISRILQDLTDNINTPISYVDDAGQFVGISIKLLTNEQITYVYDTYLQSQVGGSSYGGSLYNYSIFIPQEIYDWLGSGDYSILIDEPVYFKDALEVPVFEYVCQIDDSEDALIGDNILQQHDGFIYFYSYVNGNNINQNNAFTTTRVIYNSDNGTYVLSLACEFSFDNINNELSISIWNNCVYDPTNNSWQFGNRNNFRLGDDYAIFRHAYNIETGEEIIDLMFIAKKIPHSGTSNLVLKVNHYKLK